MYRHLFLSILFGAFFAGTSIAGNAPAWFNYTTSTMGDRFYYDTKSVVRLDTDHVAFQQRVEFGPTLQKVFGEGLRDAFTKGGMKIKDPLLITRMEGKQIISCREKTIKTGNAAFFDQDGNIIGKSELPADMAPPVNITNQDGRMLLQMLCSK